MPQFLLEPLVDAEGLDLEDDEKVNSLARRFRVSTAVVRYRLWS